MKKAAVKGDIVIDKVIRNWFRTLSIQQKLTSDTNELRVKKWQQIKYL